MRTPTLIAALTVALSGAAFAAGGGDDHTPLHGGIVVDAKEADFELVATPQAITLYVRGHGGKPLNTQGATGKVTLLNGAEKSEAALTPAGADRLEAKGSFKVASGTKLVASVTLAGKKPVNVRFAIK